MSKELARPVAQEDGGMADVSILDRSNDGAGELADVIPGPPRWVKVFAIGVLVLVVLVAVVHIASGGNHGRHMPSGTSGDHPPASRLIASGVRHA